ncbi:MAG: PEP-CTERM sorting domain-containing protein [Candidatus Omnitrophota bacterium]
MKKFTFVITLMLAGSTIFAVSAYAALLNVDSLLPSIQSIIGTYNYDASNNLFSSKATPFSVTFDSATTSRIDNGSYVVGFHVDEAGNFSGGIVGDDLVITGDIDIDNDGAYEYSGVLIAGEITDFGWLDTGTKFDAFNYTFDFTGGSLAEFYEPHNNLGVDTMTSEKSTFEGIFTEDFFGGNKAKHSTSPISPEPSSMLLLGSGLLGLAMAGFRRK